MILEKENLVQKLNMEIMWEAKKSSFSYFSDKGDLQA